MGNDRLLTTLRKTLKRRSEDSGRLELGQELSDSSFNVGFKIKGQRLAAAIYPATVVPTSKIKLTAKDIPNL